MQPSIYKQKKTLETKEKAIALYKEGLSTREVGKVVRKSHQWVAKAVRELSTAK